MNNRLAAFLIASVLLFSTACGSTRIERILSDPGRYRQRTVRVNGTVTDLYGAIMAGLYEIADGSGKIYVVSSRGVPPLGARVRVTGNVVSGLTMGGRSYGTAIRERSHRLR